MTGCRQTAGPSGEHERRGSSRFQLAQPLTCALLTEAPQPAVLEEISGGGLVLRLDGWLGSSPENGRARVLLDLGRQRVLDANIDCRRILRRRDGLWLHARFGPLTASEQRDLAGFLTDLFLAQPSSLQELSAVDQTIGRFERMSVTKALEYHLLAHQRTLRMFAAGGAAPTLLLAEGLEVEAARQLIATRISSIDQPPPGPGSVVTVVFDGPNALIRFESSIWRMASDRLWLTVPPALRAEGFRESIRTGVPPVQGAKVHFAHPRQREVILTRPIIDLGGHGLAIPIDPRTDALYPGERLAGLVLSTPDGPVRANGILRSLAPMPPGRILRGGIELTDFKLHRHAERFRKFVFEASYPRTRLLDSAEMPQAWQALDASGYVALLPENQRSSLETQFQKDWEACARETKHGRFFMVYEGERPVATAAANLLYPRTWLPHHFGVDQKLRQSGRQHLFDFARETYSGIMHLLSLMTEAEHFVFFFDSAKNWHELAFRRFLDAYQHPGDFVWDGFNLYRHRDSGAAIQEKPSRRLRIRSADPAAIALLSHALRRTTSPLEFQAYSYAEQEIELREFSEACATQGYERSRRIWIAWHGASPQAALIAETGSEGLNIFGLFNRCWIVSLTGEPSVRQDVKHLLLHEAREHYRRRGKLTFLFQDQAGAEDESLRSLGLVFEAHGLRWLAHRRIIPAYLHYVRETMGIMSEGKA